MKSNALDSDTSTVNLIDWTEMRSNSGLCQVIIEIRSTNKRGVVFRYRFTVRPRSVSRRSGFGSVMDS